MKDAKLSDRCDDDCRNVCKNPLGISDNGETPPIDYIASADVEDCTAAKNKLGSNKKGKAVKVLKYILSKVYVNIYL